MSLGLNLNVADATNSVASTFSGYNDAGAITPPVPSTTSLPSSVPTLDRTLGQISAALTGGPPPLTPTVPAPSLPSLPGAGTSLGIPLPPITVPFDVPPIPSSLATGDASGLVSGLLSNANIMGTIKSASGLDMTLPESVTSLVNNSIARDAFSVVAGAGAALALKSGIMGLSLASCNPNISLPTIPKLGDFFGVPPIPDFSFKLPKLKTLGVKSLLKNILCNTASGLNQLPSLTSSLASKVGETEVARDLMDGMTKVASTPGVNDVMYGLDQAGLLGNNLVSSPMGDIAVSGYIDKSVINNGSTKDPDSLFSSITDVAGNKVPTISNLTAPIDAGATEVSLGNLKNATNLTDLSVQSNMDNITLPQVDDEEVKKVDKPTAVASVAKKVKVEKTPKVEPPKPPTLTNDEVRCKKLTYYDEVHYSYKDGLNKCGCNDKQTREASGTYKFFHGKETIYCYEHEDDCYCTDDGDYKECARYSDYDSYCVN